MIEVAYPGELTSAHWDKQRIFLIMARPAGIGEALKALKRRHDDVRWGELNAARLLSTGACDDHLNEWRSAYHQRVAPVVAEARAVRALAAGIAAELVRNPLTWPAAKSLMAVAEAAGRYIAALEAYEAARTRAILARRDDITDIAAHLAA